jgi:hypothetical protein
LNLGKTKTAVPRRGPVHPTLARVLAEWKPAGWESTYGRMPTPDDLITPTRDMTERTAQETPSSSMTIWTCSAFGEGAGTISGARSSRLRRWMARGAICWKR